MSCFFSLSFFSFFDGRRGRVQVLCASSESDSVVRLEESFHLQLGGLAVEGTNPGLAHPFVFLNNFPEVRKQGASFQFVSLDNFKSFFEIVGIFKFQCLRTRKEVAEGFFWRQIGDGRRFGKGNADAKVSFLDDFFSLV